MKYIRFFSVVAVLLFIIPFLGVPQAFKDFLILTISSVIGFFIWIRIQALKHRKEMIEAAQKEKEHTT